jgi:hypothetical protein
MQAHVARVRFELVEQPLPPGLPIADIPDYARSRACQRRLTTLVTRRGFLWGIATVPISAAVTGRADAQPSALISLMTLSKNTWRVREQVTGRLGLKDRGANGGVDQHVRNAMFEPPYRQLIRVPTKGHLGRVFH